MEGKHPFFTVETKAISPEGLYFGTATGYSYPVYRFGNIGVLKLEIVGKNTKKGSDYTIGSLGGYQADFDVPLIAYINNKPVSEQWHLKCIKGVLHVFAGGDYDSIVIACCAPFWII